MTKSPAHASPTGTTVADPDDDREKIAGYPVHPAASLFPLLPDDELQALADDIAAHGQLEAILLHQGEILDGRNRARACEIAGVTPKVDIWRPAADETPSTYVVSRNLRRRHMTASQRATVAVELSEQISEERAAQRALEESRRMQFSNVGADKDTPTRNTPSQEAPGSPFMVPQPVVDPTSPRFRARDQAASALNVSSAYVTDAKNLSKADPGRFAKVRSGALSLPEANRQVVKEARDAGTLDDLPIRPGVKREALSFLDQAARDIALEDRPKSAPTTPAERKAQARPAIKMPKFGKLDSTRVQVTVNLTMGHPEKAQELLEELNRDMRVIEIEYDVTAAQTAAKGKKKK